MITVNSRKFDGSIRRSWNCELVEDRGSLLTFVGKFDEDVRHADLGHIKKDTASYEYYWRDRWYSIFRFHEPSGGFRNLYCNINIPPRFENGVLDYVDLDIDVVVWPDFNYVVLDREEFERNASLFNYPTDVKEKVEATLRELLELIDQRRHPDIPELFATSSPEMRGSR